MFNIKQLKTDYDNNVDYDDQDDDDDYYLIW